LMRPVNTHLVGFEGEYLVLSWGAGKSFAWANTYEELLFYKKHKNVPDGPRS